MALFKSLKKEDLRLYELIEGLCCASFMSPFANTPQPPYYAVIFSSQRRQYDAGYEAMAARMMQLASEQTGFLGAESARNAEGFGITVSYWQDLDSIRAWKWNEEHLVAQAEGKASWYELYHVRISKVELAYEKELK